MKKISFLLLFLFITIFFTGCLPTNQAEQALDLVFGKPRVKSTMPKNKAEEIALDSNIVIEFNKDVDGETLNNKNIVIEYLNNDELGFYVNPFLGSNYDYNSNNRILTINPDSDFLPNQEIEVKLLAGIKNKEGSELARTWGSGENDNIRYVFKFKTQSK